MRNPLIACVVSLTCVVGASFAGEDRTEKQTQAARYFKFEGVGFATTPGQFKKLHPEFEAGSHADKKIGIVELVGDSKAASVIEVSYFEGNMYQMFIIYDANKVSKIGGSGILLRRLKEKFGNVESDWPRQLAEGPDNFECHWEMKDAGKHIALFCIKGFTVMKITDTVVSSSLLEKKGKLAETGF